MTKINILIVEDNKDHVFFIKKFLPAERYDLQEIVNGKEAYNYLLCPKVKPDVILLDYHLPGMNGLEILEKLGAKKEAYGFILTTVDTDPDILVKALKNGASDLLLKTPEYLYTLPLKIEKSYKFCQSKLDKKVTEANFKSIIESGEDDIWSLDTQFRITAFNKSFKNAILKLYDFELKIGDNILEINSEKLKNFWKPKYEKALKGKKLAFEFSPLDNKLLLCLDVSLNPIIIGDDIVGLSAIGRDITERKKIEEDLFNKNQFLEKHLNQTPLAVIYTDVNMIIREWNLAAKRIFGYTTKEVLGKNLFDLVVPKDILKEIKAVRQNLLKDLSGSHHQNRNKTKSGREIICNWFNSVIKDENEKAVGFACLVEDVTDSLENEKALKNSEKKFREIFEKSGDAILVIKNGIFIDCNKATIKMLKYKSKKAFLNTHPSVLSPKYQTNGQDSFSEAEKMMQAALKKGTYRFEWLHKKQDGTIFPVEVLLTAISNEPQNKVIHCVWRDITDRKQAEQLIKESAQIIDQSPNVVFLWKNKKGWPVEHVSRNVSKLLGYTTEELLSGKISYESLIHKDDLSRVSEEVQRKGSRFKHFEQQYRIITKKGVIKWVKDNTTTRIDAKKNITHYQGIITDITESKKAQEALKQSDQLYKSVFESSPLGIFHFNKKSVITDVNDELVRIIGSTRKKIVGLNIHRDFNDKKMIEAVRCTLEKGSGYYEDNYTSVTANKTTPLVIRFKAIKDVENKIIGGIGLCEDITERKKIEKALKENEHQLQEAQTIAKLGHFIYEESTKEFKTSKILDDIVGVDDSYVKDRQGWFSLCHPDDINKALSIFASKTKKSISTELRIIRYNDKKTIWVSLNIKIEYDSKKIRTKITGTIQDITERKLNEEKIKQSEQKLLEFQKITNLGTFIFDDSTGVFETGPVCDAILGIDALYKRDIQGWIKLAHPEDYQEVKDLLDNNEIKTLFKELRIVRPKDKKTVWILSNISKEFNDKGIRTKITGTIQDITPHKLAEEKLKQSDIILNKIDSIVKVFDDSGNITYISPSVETVLGFKPKELMGKGWWRKTTTNLKEANALCKAVLNNVHKGIIPNKEIIQRSIKTKNGKEIILEWVNSKGIGNTHISIGIDVTEKYRQENLNNVIYNITKKANEALPQELFFDFIRLQLSKLIDTTNFYIALGNENSEFLTVPYMIDEKDTKADFLKKNSLSGYVIDTKNTLLLKNSDKKSLKIIEQGPESKCWLGTPLIIDNNAIGVMVVQSYADENAYTIEDVKLLELIANSISQVIKQSEDFEQINLLSHALMQSDEGIIITNVDGEIQYVNPAFTKLSGYTEKEVIGQNPRFLKSGVQTLEYYETLWNTILSGDTWNGEFINKRKDCSQYLVSTNISPMKNSKGKITHFVAVEEDITERRKLEHDFLHAFIDAQEIEKQSFGEDLHDGVSQILSAQTMFVDVLKTLLKDADVKTVKYLNTIKDLNTKAINETRSIAHGLMSKQLKESGLIVAVAHICKDYSTSRDIDFSFRCKGIKEQEINREIKSNIFRILQEVSTNTVRHSVAKKAQIKLSKTTNNQLKVVVKDNGIGIDFKRMKENKKGAGLENIKRRIKLLNGTMDLKTAPNNGTQYTFIIPLDNIQ